jgi:predicted S18 family serine protease
MSLEEKREEIEEEDAWAKLEAEGKEMANKLMEKSKLKLFDLYDRCRYPIARIVEVKYHINALHVKYDGDYITLELEGRRFCSAHFDAIKSVAEEVLGENATIDFNIVVKENIKDEEPLKAEVVISW